jgi:hypothetical protein
MGQREKDSGGRAPVLGLEEKDARRASRHLRLRLLMMLSRYDDHSMTRKRNPVRAIHGVLQERPCPDERAVLFGPGRAQLALDEITRSASFSTGEDDRPQAVLARLDWGRRPSASLASQFAPPVFSLSKNDAATRARRIASISADRGQQLRSTPGRNSPLEEISPLWVRPEALETEAVDWHRACFRGKSALDDHFHR